MQNEWIGTSIITSKNISFISFCRLFYGVVSIEASDGGVIDEWWIWKHF
jgi:hypothetical protein